MATVAVQAVDVEAPDTGVWVRRWTRKEYHRMARLGILRSEECTQLIEGEIIVMAAQLSPHATGVRLAEERAAFGPGFEVRAQLPLALGERSEPEPDVAVVPGSIRDYEREHPTSALLVVEVSDTTVRLDRERKGSLYARAGIPEYWLVNLRRRRLEVYRDPPLAAEAQIGARYQTQRVLTEEETVTPLAVPGARVPVADLLPRRRHS